MIKNIKKIKICPNCKVEVYVITHCTEQFTYSCPKCWQLFSEKEILEIRGEKKVKKYQIIYREELERIIRENCVEEDMRISVKKFAQVILDAGFTKNGVARNYET